MLITGATGRVGRLVVDELRVSADVRVLQRGEGEFGALRGVDVVRASVLDSDAVERAVGGVDVVCHLAALMPPAENVDVFETNVRGTFNVLEAIRRQGTQPRLVFASTDATYGTGWSKRDYPEPIREEVDPRPTNFYGSSKVLCERMLRDYGEFYGIGYVALRFCWVFAGTEVLDLFTMTMWEEFMNEDQRRRFDGSDAVPVLYEEDGTPFMEHVVDARDCARAVALATGDDRALGEVINVSGPAPFRYVDVSPRVATRLERPLAELSLKNFHGYSFDIDKADQLLGFRPRYDIGSMLDEVLFDVAEAAT